MNFKIEFLSFSVNRFETYKKLGEQAIDQLNDSELYMNHSKSKEDEEGDNSIAIIIQHMAGNMLSRWTNFLTEDGEKNWRHRDREFDFKDWTREELLAFWEKGWQCLFKALDEVNEDNFDATIYIRNEGHSITEAILRQLTHYAYHVGQIVHIAKINRGNKWKTLSIGKNKSAEFNDTMDSK